MIRQILAAVAAALALAAAPAFAQDCPQVAEGASVLNHSASELYSPVSYDVTAGGSLDLSSCGEVPGSGYVVDEPDFSMYYDADENYDLEFRAQGNCDVVLLVNDANGDWHFSDDTDGGSNSLLRLVGPADGRYDVWVGTYEPKTCNATLGIETFLPAVATTPAAGECPEIGEGARVINHTARELYSPVEYQVTAGGDLSLSNCPDVGGVGYVIAQPDFSMNYDHNQDYELEFRADGECDVVLLVNDANGDWHFSDDSGGGYASLLRLTAPTSGRYDVWVGTYGAEYCDATLGIETF